MVEINENDDAPKKSEEEKLRESLNTGQGDKSHYSILEQENWGEYKELDISSLSRDEGIRQYFRVLNKNYLNGGVTLAQKAEEEEEAKLKGKLFAPADPEEDGFDSDMSD